MSSIVEGYTLLMSTAYSFLGNNWNGWLFTYYNFKYYPDFLLNLFCVIKIVVALSTIEWYGIKLCNSGWNELFGIAMSMCISLSLLWSLNC